MINKKAISDMDILEILKLIILLIVGFIIIKALLGVA